MKHSKGILLVMFFLGMLAGTFLCNIYYEAPESEPGIVSDYFLNRIADNPIDKIDFLFYIVKVRYPQILLLGLLAVTVFGLPMACVMSAKWGMNLAFILSAAIIRFGMKGLLLFSGFMLPQCILFIPVYGQLLLETMQCSVALGYRKDRERKKEICVRYYIHYIIGLLLIFAGIWLESYVNPAFMQKVLACF